MTSHEVTSVDTALFRPARPRRAFDEIIGQIRDLLDSGKLQPGDRLPSERALAEQFSVSRNTVREAFRMLEISGLITLRRGARGGAFITGSDASVMAADLTADLKLTDFSLEDLSESMRQLCGVVLDVAGPRLTEQDFVNLEEVLARAEALREDADRPERISTLIEFYAVLAAATDNPILVVLMNSLLDIVRRVVPLLHTPDHDFVIASRRQLIDHLRRGDLRQARRELDAYLVRLHSRWMQDDSVNAVRRARR